MHVSRFRFALPTVLIAGTVLAGSLLATTIGLGFTPVASVPNPNPRIAGLSSQNVLPPELMEVVAAQGSNPVENPVAGGGTVPAGCPAVSGSALRLAPNVGQLLSIGFYGYDTTLSGSTFVDKPLMAAPGVLPDTDRNEATKTEADENTYLVLRNQHGPDPNYDYGTHFLFQGHELGRGFITRINLDADYAHHVTVMASAIDTSIPIPSGGVRNAPLAGTQSCPLPTVDGTVWDPFARKLLFTSEGAGNQSILQMSPEYGSIPQDLTPWMGQAAYEGMAVDQWGRVYLVEDASGAAGSAGPPDLRIAKQPNSFVYRYVPYVTGDLKQGGQLQVLQVASLAHAGPIKFGGTTAAQIDADILSQDVKDLHTYGKVFDTQWVTIHDTATAGPNGGTNWSGNVNTLAKAANGTPFKRPENGRFRPGTDFSEFYFTETADTNANTQAGATYGGFGAIMKLKLLWGNTGKLSLLYNAPDGVHAGFDNMAFWDTDHLAVVEDAGATLHGQRNSLDNTWLFNLKTNYSNTSNQPKRLMAEGRDPSATVDAGFAALAAAQKASFQNEDDNEITGWVTSDGDPSIWGLMAAKPFKAFQDGFRTFFTQQHGENTTWEILPADANDFAKDHDHDRDDNHRFGFDRRKGGHDRDDDDDDRGSYYGRNW